MKDKKFRKTIEIILLANYIVSLFIIAINAIFRLGLDGYFSVLGLGSLLLLILWYTVLGPLPGSLLFLCFSFKALSWVFQVYGIDYVQLTDLLYRVFVYVIAILFLLRVRSGRSKAGQSRQAYIFWLFLVFIVLEVSGPLLGAVSLTKWLNYFIVALAVNIKFSEDTHELLNPTEHKYVHLFALYALSEICFMMIETFA